MQHIKVDREQKQREEHNEKWKT